jgi:tRNA-splicing ligase RtcB
VNIHHNYAAEEEHFGHTVLVHRKGATSARAGQAGIILAPWVRIAISLKDWAARKVFNPLRTARAAMGRNEATRKLDLEREQQKMKGIIHNLRSKSALDEAPGAYKDIDEVMAQQQDLVKIVTRLKPLAVIKG